MWDIRTALCCWVDQGAEIDKFFNYCNLLSLNCDYWWFILPTSQNLDFCLLPVHLKPKMWTLMPSSQLQVQGVKVALRQEQHHQQNPDPEQVTHHSCLRQQFFPAPVHARGERVWYQHTEHSYYAMCNYAIFTKHSLRPNLMLLRASRMVELAWN